MNRTQIPVLTAMTGPWESALAVALDARGSDLDVVRRCADLGELLSAAAAGLGRAAIVSADLPRLDRDAVAQVVLARVAVVGLFAPGDDAGRLRLNRLGVRRVLRADAPAAEISQVVTAACRQLQNELQNQLQNELQNQRIDGGGPADVVVHEREGAVTGVGSPVDAGNIRDATVFAEPEADVQSRALPLMADPASALTTTPRMPARPAAIADPVDGLRAGRLVVVWGPVGAPGRTTMAVNLAAELAAAGRTCLLVDADTYGASVAQALGLLDESAGLAAAARAANTGQLDVHRLAELAPVVCERLRVLTGLPQPRRWPELRPAALDVVWEQARQLADCVIIDAGFGIDADEELMFDTAAPRRHGAALSALGASDLVLAVGAADPIGLQRLLAGLPDLQDLTGGAVPIQVVVTKVRDQAIGGQAAARIRGALDRYAGISDPALIPDDRAALDLVMLAGRTLTEAAPSAPARLAIADLAARLVARGGVLDDGRSTGPVSAIPSTRRGWRRRVRAAGRRSPTATGRG